jgi:hypothetical protein
MTGYFITLTNLVITLGILVSENLSIEIEREETDAPKAVFFVNLVMNIDIKLVRDQWSVRFGRRLLMILIPAKQLE